MAPIEEDYVEEDKLSEIEKERTEELKLLEQIRERQLRDGKNNRMVVGTGFNMDITEFF